MAAQSLLMNWIKEMMMNIFLGMIKSNPGKANKRPIFLFSIMIIAALLSNGQSQEKFDI